MRYALLGVLAVLLMMAGSACGAAAEGGPEPHPAHALTTRFTWRITVSDTRQGTRSLAVWVPVPSDSHWQTVSNLEVESPVPHRVTQERGNGNRMVFLRVEAPRKPVTATVRFTVLRRPVQALAAPGGRPSQEAGPSRNLRRLIRPDRRVPIGGRLGKLAREATAGKSTPLEKARALYEHVVTTMQYDYKRESPKLGEGDVPFVCDYRKGNCSDLHSYAISLARSLGIPAVLEFGLPLTGVPLTHPVPVEGAIGGYHCWMWCHIAGTGWIPVDAADGRRWRDAGRPEMADYLFGNLVPERTAVALSRGRDIILEPRQRGEALNYFIYPYAEADGKPVTVWWEMGYRLLESAPTREPSRQAAPSPE